MTSNKSSFIFYTLKCLIHEPPTPEQGNEFLHKVLPNKRCQLTALAWYVTMAWLSHTITPVN